LARGFSRQPGHHVDSTASAAARLAPQRFLASGFPWTPASAPELPLSIWGARPCLLRPPFAHSTRAQDCLPALHRLRCYQPRLRSRLTLGRLPLPRNPQASGVVGSHHHSRYSFRHSRFGSLQVSSRSPFSATPERSPTTRPKACPWVGSAASVRDLSPVLLSAQEHSTSELLRTLSRVAASKPTSWLSMRSHYLSHSAPPWGP
jgi:hypothetical protein